MSNSTNEYGQPIGAPVPGWSPRPLPSGVTLEGAYCRLEALDVDRHASDLYSAYRAAPDGRDWTYLAIGPFDDEQVYRRYAETAARSTDPRHYAVIDKKTGKAVGTLALMRIEPAQGAFAEVMENDPQHARDLAGFYQAKRDRFRELLAGSRFQLPAVHGGYFQLADYSAIRDTDDLNFCEWMVREAGVAAIPVSAFYETAPDARLVRFCFAKNDETLQAAAERLCKL